MSFCKRNQDDIIEEVDLIEVAKEKEGGIEILVDYYAFQQWLVGKFYDGLCKFKDNPYIKILGGEYASFEAYLTKFVEDFKSLGIALVFYVDGAKGSSGDTARQKMDTWMQRHHRDTNKIQQILNVCNNRKSIEDLEDTVRFVLEEVQVMHTLSKCECEVFQVPVGEADYVIALALQTRSKAFAILSNDSDFCIFKDSLLIPLDMFDLKNEMQLGATACLPEKPVHLVVGLISSSQVMQSLRVCYSYQ